ncbi:MAG TPA: DUF1003 domain-containing protein [Candidatus Limnocylindria bacterium]|nr:DUF1003 domain-containing protein [Candidatus Limnocylindria bacterium]
MGSKPASSQKQSPPAQSNHRGMVDSVVFYLNPFSSHQENVSSRRKLIRSFKAREDAKRTPAERFADWLTSKFGSVTFLAANALWFVVWISINTRLIPGIEPFDPFPFGLLTMVVSLEAIFLAIVVLISQNREARVGELREEIELQISTIAETELTKLINLMVKLMKEQGIEVDKDPELKKMLHPVDNAALERKLEKELEK